MDRCDLDGQKHTETTNNQLEDEMETTVYAHSNRNYPALKASPYHEVAKTYMI